MIPYIFLWSLAARAYCRDSQSFFWRQFAVGRSMPTQDCRPRAETKNGAAGPFALGSPACHACDYSARVIPQHTVSCGCIPDTIMDARRGLPIHGNMKKLFQYAPFSVTPPIVSTQSPSPSFSASGVWKKSRRPSRVGCMRRSPRILPRWTRRDTEFSEWTPTIGLSLCDE